MEDLKIKIESDKEAREAIKLAELIGYKADTPLCYNWSEKNQYLCLCSDMSAGFLGLGGGTANDKEITILQLRDLVVLNRNDAKDANVYQDSEIPCLYDLYLTENKELYFYHCGKELWVRSNISNDESYYKYLKPIEKIMKEYLNKSTGEYKKTDEIIKDIDWIEIPDGADTYVRLSHEKKYHFRKTINGNNYLYCLDNTWNHSFFTDDVRFVLWQRETKPEELPFIDDESALDKIKIKVNGDLSLAISIAKLEGYHNCQFNKIPDDAYWLLCNENGTVDYSMTENIVNEYALLHTNDNPDIKYMDGCSLGKTKSLNDQYAEIEQVRQAIKSDGGSTDYYQKEIPKWMLEQFNKTGVIEAKDVIRLFLGNDFNKGNIFKAQVRINSLESGAGKEGISGEYDHNKIVFFAEDDRKAYLGSNQ